MKINRMFALSLVAASVGASAQSSVTLYGVVDANIRYVKNSGLPSNYGMSNSGLSSGRLGFRGIEDLGGGLKAGFVLESDVNADTGTTSSKFFNRRSTVSLIGGFGEFRLGRDLTPASAHVYRYDPWGVIGIGSSLAASEVPLPHETAGITTNYYRSDNAIQYFTPVVGGVKAEFMFAPDEQSNDNRGRHLATRLVYDNGPLSVSLSYGSTNLITLPAGAVGQPKLRQTGLAASYNFGVVKVMGFIQRDDLPYGTYNTHIAGPEDKYLLGFEVPMGVHLIRGSYVRTNSRKGGATNFYNRDADKYAIGYVHNLSKRTAIYTSAAFINNKGDANFALSGGAAGLAAGGNSKGAEFGIRHSF